MVIARDQTHMKGDKNFRQGGASTQPDMNMDPR